MGNRFASGKWAWGTCERCGFRADLAALKSEVVRGRSTGNLICPDCFDPDHPQNFQGMTPVDDPQALRNPSPDPALEASRQIPDNAP